MLHGRLKHLIPIMSKDISKPP